MHLFHPRRSAWSAIGLTAALWVLLMLMLMLVACSSLPKLVPDLARSKAPPVQLEGRAGPLSAARSQAVLDRLRRSSPDTGVFDHHLAFEEAVVGSPLTVGNQVHLLQDGPATYRAMLTAIAAARDHINMETYIFDADAVGRQFMQALVAKQRQGVSVQLIRDSVGTIETPAEFFQQLVDSGARVLEFNPINPLTAVAAGKDWTLNQRDHRKLLIVDGETAFIGGINISSVYSGGSLGQVVRARPDASLAWRDTDLQLQGPVVAELQKGFLAQWRARQGPPLPNRAWFPAQRAPGRDVVRAIGSSPEDAYSLIYVTLLSAIANARTSISLTNAYFVPDPQLLEALEAAARRGVEVTLILPSRTDSWLVFHAGRRHYARLLRTGVRIYERQGVILHSKTALIDGVWATVGSTNLDWRSFLHNHELNVVVLGTAFGSQLQALFERDRAVSEAILPGPWAERGIELQLQEAFAALWEYWL